MIKRKLFLGFIRIHILYHASKELIYGKEIKEELRRHVYEISFGTLYPILHSLEKSGYLKKFDEIVNGKIRNYYKITKEGLEIYNESKLKVKELFDEIFED